MAANQESTASGGEARDRYLNQTIAKFDEVLARHQGEKSFSEKLVQTELVMGNFIYQSAGQGNRRHYHATENEFWVILKGTLKWDFFEGETIVESVIATAGDVVVAKAGRWHHITVVGDEPSVRFAVVKPDVLHIYV